MPYKTTWIDPDICVEHNGIKVFHTYDDDNFDKGPMVHWFTMDPKFTEEDEGGDFDVRMLPAWKELVKLPPLINIDSDSEEIVGRKREQWGEFREKEPGLIRHVLRLSIERGDLCPS